MKQLTKDEYDNNVVKLIKLTKSTDSQYKIFDYNYAQPKQPINLTPKLHKYHQNKHKYHYHKFISDDLLYIYNIKENILYFFDVDFQYYLVKLYSTHSIRVRNHSIFLTKYNSNIQFVSSLKSSIKSKLVCFGFYKSNYKYKNNKIYILQNYLFIKNSSIFNYKLLIFF